MGINGVTNVGISLVSVGKKDLTNQNVWTESQWGPKKNFFFKFSFYEQNVLLAKC